VDILWVVSLAGILDLPVISIVENNGYFSSTCTRHLSILSTRTINPCDQNYRTGSYLRRSLMAVEYKRRYSDQPPSRPPWFNPTASS